MSLPARIADRSPCEKLVELLFCRYLLEVLAADGAQLFAPSSRLEAVEGYDARIAGAGVFRELYLQFKVPSLLAQPGFSIRASTEQHALLRTYPPSTAFYIAPTFRSVREVMEAQTDAAADPMRFLARFLCVDARCLPYDVRVLQYASDSAGGPDVKEARYKRAVDDVKAGRILRRATHPLVCDCWFSADVLVRHARSRAVGALVIVEQDAVRGGNGSLNGHRTVIDQRSESGEERRGLPEDNEPRILLPEQLRAILARHHLRGGSEDALLRGGNRLRLPA